MPELPEVEVLRRSLVPWVIGTTVESVVIRRTDLREPVDRQEIERRIVGRRFLGVDRRAKYLLLRVEGDSTLVIHLGMSGRMTIVPPEHAVEPHEHLSFLLSSGLTMRFRDPRRFGLCLALETSRLVSDPHFAHLGIEPLSSEFSGQALRELARGRRAPVKSFLMDGRIVVGVGNIYACEALHRAGVHPKRSVARISRQRWNLIAGAIADVLLQAIDQGGTTLNDFRNAAGDSGYFQVSLAAYGREGDVCSNCGGEIRRIVQAGRSTFYCPRCQR